MQSQNSVLSHTVIASAASPAQSVMKELELRREAVTIVYNSMDEGRMINLIRQ